MCSTRSASVSTWPYIIVAVVDMPEPVRVAHDAEPVGRLRLLRRDDLADAVDEDLGASAGDRVEPRVAEPRQRGGDGQLRAARDVLDLGRRQRVQVDRVALLERAEEVLVVVDPEVRVVAALHEDAGAADRERLLDLLVDDRLREQVALGAVAGPAVEGAEVAVGDADVRVVDVAVDDERDPAGVRTARAELVRGLADRDEVLRLEERRAPRRRRSARRREPSRGSARSGQAFLDRVHLVAGDFRPYAGLVPVDDHVALRVQDAPRNLERSVYALALAPLGRNRRSKILVPSVMRTTVCPRPLVCVLPTPFRQPMLFVYE